MKTTRREILAGAAGAFAGAVSGAAEPDGPVICAFSKHFQWTDIGGMARTCAQLGFDGIDLTVRAGGHVAPASVADDLPRAVERIRAEGLKAAMLTTGIVDAMSPHAEAVLAAMKPLGIRWYRWGGFRYDLKRSLPAQIAEFRARTRDLAAMNRQYGVCAMYHTHSGTGQAGASMWDLHMILDGLDPESVSVNYDIGHATVEGGYGGWRHSSRLLMPRIRGVAVKDFYWRKAGEKWVLTWCALGQGMVNFSEFLPMLKTERFRGPLQLHLEYEELGGADSGKKTLTIPKDEVLSLIRRDLETLKRMLAAAQQE